MTTPLDHANIFVSTIHAMGGGTMELTALAFKRKPIKQYFHRVDLLAEQALDLNAQGYSVFLGVNPRNKFDGHEDAVSAVGALPLDLDFKRGADARATLQMLNAFGIPPTVIVASGNGMHMYLCLAELVEPAAGKHVARRLCGATSSDKVFNTNRIMRIPGSVNWKQPSTWCYLTEVNYRRYTLEQIEQALDAAGVPRPAKIADGVRLEPDATLDGVPAEEAWAKIKMALVGSEDGSVPGVRGGREALGIIEFGEKNPYSEGQPTRSEADWVVVCGLIRAGATDELIRWVYEKFPVGMMKYAETGRHYLEHTIQEARRRTAEARLKGRSRSRPPTRFTGGSGDTYRVARGRKWGCVSM